MADLFNDMLNSLDSLTPDQVNELLSRLEVKKSGQTAVTKDAKGLLMENGQVVACPHCGSVSARKDGTRAGKQKYFCKDCHKRFTAKTGTLSYHSKLTPEQWKGLLKGVVLNLSLSKIADDIGVSIQTVWYNKNKICNALQELFPEQDKQLAGIVECDEYIVRMSFKGKRDPAFFINILDRMPKHHRTRAEKLEYLEKNGLLESLQKNPERLERLLTAKGVRTGKFDEHASVLTCKDRNSGLYIAPVCIGRIENEHVFQHLTPKINRDSIMVTDSYAPYLNFAEMNNIHIEQILSQLHARGAFNLGHINALHSRLSAYWPASVQRDPATKYLDLHLMLFWWLEKNSDKSIAEKVEILYNYMSEQYYDNLTYDSLTHRELRLDTKHLIPSNV